MKGRLVKVGIVGVIGLLLLGGSYYGRVGSAAPLGAPTWSSGFQIQNLDGANPANVTVIYRDGNGAQVHSQSLTVPAGGSTTIFPLPVSGFDGTVEIQSDRPVAAIANLLTSNPTMLDSYIGVTSPGTQAFLPLIMRENGGYSTAIYIQNTDTAGPANVSLEYRRTGSASVVKSRTVSIPAGGRATIRQLEDDSDLGSGWVGSVRVSSDRPVAAVVTQSNGSILFSYNGFSQGSQRMYLPLIMCANSGWCTGLQVMNVGSGPTAVTLKVDGVVRDTVNLGPYESKTWYPVLPGTMTQKHIGSGVLEASAGGQIVAIVNELNVGLGQGMSYVGFGGGTSAVSLPLVMTNNSNYQVGVQIQNLGPSDVTVQVRAVSNDGSVARNDTVTVPANKSTTLYPAVGTIPGPRFVGSMTITGPSGSQLVAIANQITQPQQPGDTSAVYNAFNQ